LLRTVLVLIILFLLLVWAFSFPSVQTGTAQYLADNFNKKYDVNFRVERVAVGYDGTVELRKVIALDEQQDTMIYVRSLKTGILSFADMLSGDVALGDTSLDGVILNVVKLEGEDKDNFTRFLDKLRKPKKEPSGKSSVITASGLELTNGTFRVIDENLTYPESFIAHNTNLTLDELEINGGDLFLDVSSLEMRMYNGAMKSDDGERRWLYINDLTTQFTYTSVGLQARDLIIETAGSRLEGNMNWTYEISDFSDFVNKVQWDMQIESAVVSTDEIRMWYTGMVANETIQLQGDMTGTLNDFTVADLQMEALGNLTVDGQARITNAVTDLEKFSISGHFNTLRANRRELLTLLPEALAGKLPKQLDNFGTIDASGRLTASRDAVDLDLRAYTRQGNLNSKITFTGLQTSRPAYTGRVTLDNFNLRSLGESGVGRASLTVDLDGKGFNLDNLNINLRGGARSIEYNGYTYRNIKVDGDVTLPEFNGHLEINDPNLQMVFDGLLDRDQRVNTYDFVADIAYADLYATNIFRRDSISILKGRVEVDMRGTSINDAVGAIVFTDASYKNENDIYAFEDFDIESSFTDGERLITIDSKEIIDGEIRGLFRLEDIPDLVKNSIGNLYTNYQGEEIEQGQYLSYEFQIYDKIVDLFFPELQLGENTILKGNLSSDDGAFKLTFRTPQVTYKDIALKTVNVQVDNKNPLFNTYVQLEEIDNGYYDIQDFKLINVTVNDTLQFRTEFKSAEQQPDVYKFSLYHTVNEMNQSVIGFKRGEAKFNERDWAFAKENTVPQLTFDHQFQNFSLDTLQLKSKSQSITLGGIITGTENKNAFVDLKKVRIGSLLTPIDSLSVRGQLDGHVTILQEDGIYYPTSKLQVTDFLVNETPLGDFMLDVSGDQSLSEYTLNAYLKDDIKKSFRASGTISTATAQNQMNIDINLNRFNLVALSPLGGIVVDNVHGLASGDVQLTGQLTEPQFNGSVDLYGAGLRFPYLNTDFDFQDKATVQVLPDGFDLGMITLIDTQYRTSGKMGGRITHKNFGFWELDLELNSDRLLVLDTSPADNELYYGTGFIDGTASITGPVNELFIDVKARTERGTEFFIPLSDEQDLGDSSVIYFLAPETEGNSETVSANPADGKGLEMRFDMEVTPAATVEITIDQESGSYLRGSGSGDLLVEVNTRGKFRMYGDYTVDAGVYNFRYSLINKQFNILPGGSMVWQGDPTEAFINVEAVYRTNANPSILLDNPSLNTRIPVEVITNLDGNLQFFDPEFEIRFPTANSVVASELQYRLQERSQRQLQALSLMSSGSFFNPNSIGQNAVAGNLVESISGIVNDWVQQRGDAVNFGLNYEASERNPNADFQNSDRLGITLSTKITDRVLINGKVGVPVGGAGTNERSVVGDVRVDFLINEDGTLRLKIFNRENNLQQLGQERGYTQGLGLTYSVDFNTMKELFEKIFGKKLELEGETAGRE